MLEIDVGKQRGAFTVKVQFTSATPGVTALFGRSGCGKTTTVHMIAGLLRPDYGHIRIDGTVLFDAARNIDVPAEQRGIGYVFQDARLFRIWRCATTCATANDGRATAHGSCCLTMWWPCWAWHRCCGAGLPACRAGTAACRDRPGVAGAAAPATAR